MEQNKNIDNQFRQKLNQRTIRPSDKAWDRLDAMLSVAEKKKSKRNWLWIAASLVVLLAIGSLFIKVDKIEIIPVENTVVIKKESYNEDIPENNKVNLVDNQEFKRKKIAQDTFQVVQRINIPKVDNIGNNEEQSAMEDVIAELGIEKNDDIDWNGVSTNIYITAQDLLGSIKNENPVERIKPAVTIDHRSLLYQAEMEVEQQYRKNAIDRFLQKSYDNVRVATLSKF